MALPSGTVTLLFGGIEGSTRLLEVLGERYDGILVEHRTIVRTAVAEHGGQEVRTEGDTFFVAFAVAVVLRLGIGCLTAGPAGPSPA